MLVAGSGTDLTALTTKEEVRRVFGDPVTSSESPPTDDFRTHRKLVKSDLGLRGDGPAIELCITLGLSECVELPKELFVATQQVVEGRNVRFVYDAGGKVIAVFVDGTRLYQDIFHLPTTNPPPVGKTEVRSSQP
jgi:hypothetical protein